MLSDKVQSGEGSSVVETGEVTKTRVARVPAPRIAGLVALAVTLAALSVILTTRSVEAAFPGQNGRIAFERRLDGNDDFEIWTIKPDGTGLEQVTDNDSQDRYPTWSANGDMLAFVSNRDGDEEIFVVGIRDNGTPAGPPERVTNNSTSDSDPAFSPNGKRIAFSGSNFGDPEIYTIRTDGDPTSLRQITNNDAEDYEPNWSPDGATIAYSKLTLVPVGGGFSLVRNVYTTQAAGGGTEDQITTTGSSGDPNYSPDGQQLVYKDSFDLEVINADGSGTPRTVTSGDTPAFSPTGQRIVFRGGASDIFKIRAGANAGTGRPITSGPFEDGYPDWQPR